ncbi:MAG: SemiSWEET family transporter [bacterium]|nr:SemiSWEET family transporter [bacterium]
MKNKITEAIGLISATLTTLSFVPGVISIWRLKPAPAISTSTTMYIALTIGIFGWIIYGFRIKSTPIILANIITISLSISVLLYKILYG